MKKFFAFIVIAGMGLACTKSSNSGSTHNCDISVPGANASANGSVKYEANLTGSGTISSITVKNSVGTDSTITSPSLPFQTTFNIASGTAIGISAKGSTMGSQIEIKYTFTPASGGSIDTNKQECGN